MAFHQSSSARKQMDGRVCIMHWRDLNREQEQPRLVSVEMLNSSLGNSIMPLQSRYGTSAKYCQIRTKKKIKRPVKCFLCTKTFNVCHWTDLASLFKGCHKPFKTFERNQNSSFFLHLRVNNPVRCTDRFRSPYVFYICIFFLVLEYLALGAWISKDNHFTVIFSFFDGGTD